MNNIVKALKEQRLKVGWSQTTLANHAKISLATVQNIEAGTGNPALTTIESLCKSLGLSIRLQPVFFKLDSLIDYGLPLIQVASAPAVRPHRLALIERLEALAAHSGEDFGSRENLCLHAFLLALKDHYPSLWKVLPQSIKHRLSRLKMNGAVIKLRRLALDRLAVYL